MPELCSVQKFEKIIIYGEQTRIKKQTLGLLLSSYFLEETKKDR
jgi:hypothetical protein